MSDLKTMLSKTPTKAKVQELKWKATVNRASLPLDDPEKLSGNGDTPIKSRTRCQSESGVLDIENYNIITLEKEIHEYSRKKKHKRKCKKKDCSRRDKNGLNDSSAEFTNESLNRSVVSETPDKKATKSKSNKNGVVKSSDRKISDVFKKKETPKPKNAFAIMMEARNNVIGSNLDGKDREDEEPSSPEDQIEKKTILKQRQKLLIKWAERKGSKKRKLEDEAREEYVSNVLEKRAKKLKQMLESPKSPEKNSKSKDLRNKKDRKEETLESRRPKRKSRLVEEEDKIEIKPNEKENDKVENGEECNEGKERRSLRKRDCKLNYASLIEDTRASSPEEVEFISETKSSTPSNVKLAPLFVKRGPKVDKTSIEYLKSMEAKKKFLTSGISEECIKIVEKIKEVENYEYTIFPSISHVQQIDNSFIWNLPQINNYPENPIEYIPEIKNFQLPIIKEPETKSFTPARPKNPKSVLKKIKEGNPEFPVMTIYRKMMKRKETDPHAMWSEKYKPICTKEILRNTKSVKQLKSWLSGWLDREKPAPDYDSDFETSSRDSFQTKNNTMVLIGPNGSGKTSAVYGIANELNLNVLEINASSFRNGKRILNDMHEATQSKHFRETDDVVDTKFSLILIEDIDIVYTSTDDGFLTAVNQIIGSAKRPVILTSSDIYSPTTQKYMNTYKFLRFQNMSPQNIIPLLQIITLIEGDFQINRDDLTILFNRSSGDFRKILLNLQLRQTESSKLCMNDLFWNLGSILKLPDITTSIESKKKQPGQFVGTNIGIEGISHFYDNLSLVDLIETKLGRDALNNPGKSTWEGEYTNYCNSLSIEHDDRSYGNCNIVLTDLVENFIERNLKIIDTCSDQRLQHSIEEQRLKSKLQQTYSNLLDGISMSAYLGPRSLGLDYYPTLRLINETERERESGNLKRGNRFCNYLRSLHINCTGAQLESLFYAFSKNNFL